MTLEELDDLAWHQKQMPDGLGLPEQCLYTTLRNLAESVQSHGIPEWIYRKDKIEAIKTYDKVTTQMVKEQRDWESSVELKKRCYDAADAAIRKLQMDPEHYQSCPACREMYDTLTGLVRGGET